MRMNSATEAHARALEALRAAEGGFVGRAALVEAMYPPGVDRPASYLWGPDSAARALRKQGYAIEGVRFHGYRLLPGFRLPDVSPPGPPPTNQMRMLAVLLMAAGAAVSREELIEAMYPPGVERPASFLDMPRSTAHALRRQGHRVVSDGACGYRLEMDAPAQSGASEPLRSMAV